MSYIDTAPHQYCGRLAHVPLYHPQGTYRDEFDADSSHLVLGGGSGEHVAVVLNPVQCAHQIVGDLIIDVLDANDKTSPGDPSLYTSNGLTEDGLLGLEMAMEEIMEREAMKSDFSDWSGHTWHRFVSHAMAWPGYRPYSPEEMSIEAWIEASVGEYVLVSAPELLANHGELEPHILTLRSMETFLGFRPSYANVLQFPSGYNVGGRGKTISDRNMRF